MVTSDTLDNVRTLELNVSLDSENLDASMSGIGY